MIGVAFGVIVGIGGFTFIYARGYSYLTNDPQACANCHVMREQFDGWVESSHRAVAGCNDCHTPPDFVGKYYTKARNGFWHSFYFTTGGFLYTERQQAVQQPGTCIHCHASVYVGYRKAGGGDLMKGFEHFNKMPFMEARNSFKHPVSCIDCHDPKTMALRVTRPGFLEGIQALAASDDPAPHLPSVERWRRGGRGSAYDVNALASRQEMRAFVCGQCHVEYYFKGPEKRLTYPWFKGLKVEQMLAYYDEQ